MEGESRGEGWREKVGGGGLEGESRGEGWREKVGGRVGGRK